VTIYPFEDKEKWELRHRCRRAIDSAGYTLVDPPARIEIPQKYNLHGALTGDLQARDSDDRLILFYLRTPNQKTIPGWLQNLARAALEIEGVDLYVVVDQVSPALRRSCKASGAGLLELGESMDFSLVLAPDRERISASADEVAEKVRILRRKLEERIKATEIGLEQDLATIHQLIRGMDKKKQNEYQAYVKEEWNRLQEWKDDISTRLDTAQASPENSNLTAIESDIERGFQSNEESPLSGN